MAYFLMQPSGAINSAISAQRPAPFLYRYTEKVPLHIKTPDTYEGGMMWDFTSASIPTGEYLPVPVFRQENTHQCQYSDRRILTSTSTWAGPAA